METWQTKIRRLRQHLRGWAKNTSGIQKKEKKKILDKLDSLDKKSGNLYSITTRGGFKTILKN